MSDVMRSAVLPTVGENTMWLDEQIWGHRLWDAQSPWLVFLEFLTVAEAGHREGEVLDGSDGPQAFRPGKRLHLRNILYNDEVVADYAERFPDSSTAWTRWLAWMQENAQGVVDRDFSYLRPRFRDFRQFASLVALMRSSTIESGSNRRWSSRFVFPFGRHAIYEDLNVGGGGASREYINFGRSGELLHQMLGRSRHRDTLRPHLTRMFEQTDPCDRILQLLQPDEPDDRQTRGNSYLPYLRHPAFDALAADWLAVFDCGLPRFDAYPHLVALSALHLCLYQLIVAGEVCGTGRPSFVCEVIAPRKTLVRELSVTSFLRNNQAPQQALDAFIKDMGLSQRWIAAAEGPAGFQACRELMREQVRWPREGDYDEACEPASLLSALRRAAFARHRQHVANVHRSYGGGAGLVSRRGTNRLRYAPTDDLLKTLIIANVPVRMEYGAFLGVLHARYGLVFGDREARLVLDQEDFDKRAFQANSERLEDRLRTLGMLRRLSDACAYVENPLRKNAS